MQVENNKIVTIDYELTNASGEIIDASTGADPLDYLHGAGNIVPGLENALTGKSVGDELKITVPAAEGYGERDDDLIQTLHRKHFPAGEIEVGVRLQAQTSGGPVMLTVTHVTEEKVTVDANHPLAGQDLTFAVKVVGIRDATEEELEHGHVHRPGHHHH